MKLTRKITFAGLLLACALTAFADAEIGETVESPLVLGKRSIALPPGKWVVVNSTEARAGTDGIAIGAANKGQYLVQLDAQNRLVAAANIRTSLFSSASGGSGGWNDATCNRNDTVFKDTLDGNFKYPTCLLVNHSTNFWTGGVPSNEYDKVIWTWYRDKKVVMPKTAIATVYVKYFSGDYVQVRYWFNPELAGIAPDTTAEWSKSPWHVDLIKSSPDHSRYIDAVKQWNQTLVSANRASLYEGKPSVSSLPALPTLTK